MRTARATVTATASSRGSRGAARRRAAALAPRGGHRVCSHLAPEARRRLLRRHPHRAVLRRSGAGTPRRPRTAEDRSEDPLRGLGPGVPGPTGGSVHVLEVARGLGGPRPRGACGGRRPEPAGRADARRVAGTASPGRRQHRFFRFRARRAVEALGRRVRARGGDRALLQLRRRGDRCRAAPGHPVAARGELAGGGPPGSLKAALDAALLVRPLRRYRESAVPAGGRARARRSRRSCPRSRAPRPRP